MAPREVTVTNLFKFHWRGCCPDLSPVHSFLFVTSQDAGTKHWKAVRYSQQSRLPVREPGRVGDGDGDICVHRDEWQRRYGCQGVSVAMASSSACLLRKSAGSLMPPRVLRMARLPARSAARSNKDKDKLPACVLRPCKPCLVGLYRLVKVAISPGIGIGDCGHKGS